MIEIRLAQPDNRKLESDIKQLIKEVNKEESGYSMKLYKKANLTSDYLIIIIYQKEKLKLDRNDLGQRIKAAFREYGLVNHTLWNEL